MDSNNENQVSPIGQLDKQQLGSQQTSTLQSQNSLANAPDQEAPAVNNFFKSKWRIILSLFIFVFLFFITATVLFAYDKLSFKNPELQDKITNVLMSVPFMPKAPKFVLATSANEHLKINKFSFDMSIATDIKNSSILFGSDKVDAQLKGKIDYSNLKEPLLDAKLQVSKDLSADVLSKNQIVYVRINKIPAMISAGLSMFGVSEDIQDQIITKWISIDTRSLETEAREVLEETESNEFNIQNACGNYLSLLNNQDVLNGITMKEERNDGVDAYHINFSPDDETLNVFWEKYMKQMQEESLVGQASSSAFYKPSDVINNLTMNIWIDKNTYLIQKSTITFTLKIVSNSSSKVSSMGMSAFQKEIPMSIVVKLSDYNKPFDVSAPKDTVEFNDLIKNLTAQLASREGALNVPQVVYPSE